MKYRRHYALPLEPPLARNSIQEESGTANGLSGIALCSSRSRTHRNSGSFSKHSRKNSQDKDPTSPKQRRPGVLEKDKRDSMTEDGSILLDPSSILDEIMAKYNGKESDNEKSPPRGLANGTASPSQPLFAQDRDGRAGKEREREETREKGEEEEGGGERKESQPNRLEDATSSRQRSAAMDTASSPHIKSKAKLASQRTIQETNRPTESSTETPVVVKTLSVERKQELRRSGSMNREDPRRSGGHWGQISGGKALGMFYHNRRSQYIEDSLEEQPGAEAGASVERDDAHPISPLATAQDPLPGGKAAVGSSTTESEVEVR